MNVYEYKKRYDPELGRYVKKNIYSGEIGENQIGGGITDFFKSKIKKAVKRGLQKVGRKTGEKVGKKISKKAGDKITQLLESESGPSQEFQEFQEFQEPQASMSDQEIAERVNRILSGGKLRKIKYF